MTKPRFGIIGSGSWSTAIAKILTDNGNRINWWIRNEESIRHLLTRHHNPQYLSSVFFDTKLINPTGNVKEVINDSDFIIIGVPSAYVVQTLGEADMHLFKNKKVISAIKGILPDQNLLLNDYLKQMFNVPLENYFAVLGPCHAEEVAAEKLSYLTFAGIDTETTKEIANAFRTPYLNTIVNHDIYGVQFAAVLKNIYALGAGIAHGLDYGDNFLSVLIANSADEMAGFLRKAGISNIDVGHISDERKSIGRSQLAIDNRQLAISSEQTATSNRQQATGNNQQATGNRQPATAHINYAASVYLGDLLVTCYSLYSRNRTFGNMIGKGYSVRSAQLEMSMVAEGYNASRSMHIINENINADMPIADTVYEILWEGLPASEGFAKIEETLV